ncbi:MAG TPA: TetR/AcrR family transcriptional regulator [Alcanivoracaceae bacterium]|nr:TetR/AcrR family transcriptional regulator [Alcanivoracaceae bacterium]
MNSAELAPSKSPKEAILESGARCFMERGFSATSIDDIAERIGATKGMVYHYFGSKAELFFEIHQRGMDALFVVINPLLKQEMTAQERFHQMCLAHARTLIATQPFQRTMSEGVQMHLHHLSNEAQRRQLRLLQARRIEYEEVFLTVLSQGVEEGELFSSNPKLAVKPILAGLNSIISWYQPRLDETDAEREKLVQTLVDTVLLGVMKAA